MRRSISNQRPLQVTVTNGDLTFIPEPLLLGHYHSTRLTGTERVMNILTGGAMAVSLSAGLYPDAPGSHQIFINKHLSDHGNPLQPPRPQAVIVVGLGQEGKLRATELADSVRQAVLAWAQRVTELDGPPVDSFKIAATLLGSGGWGVTVGQAAQLIAQGVHDANLRLAEQAEQANHWPVVGHLALVELYHDRAVEAWRALNLQAQAAPGRFEVASIVRQGVGALRRPFESGYRGADYDFISATTDRGHLNKGKITYALDTKRARAEVRGQATQIALIRNLVETASNDRNTDPQIGRTLFKLLVPIEVEPFLAGTTEMHIELDSGTAGIPWELLDTNTSERTESKPWAIRAKLLRKLRTESFRGQVVDADADSKVLVIGEPACDPQEYPPLAGAREEARAVAELLRGLKGLANGAVTELVSADPDLAGPDARTVINALLESDWRIVHIAGHGEPPAKMPTAAGEDVSTAANPVEPADGAHEIEPLIWNPRGVVLSDGTFLGPHEINSMGRVPELVFVNCCHLAKGAVDPLSTAGPACDNRNWPLFAAGVADALINVGVRCVIAAGWAVEDEPAKEFATRFYAALLAGRRFIDAVAEAREAAHGLGGNTWAAYQCYGDPDWYFRREGSDPQRPVASASDEFAFIASPIGLKLALETLAVRSEYQRADPASQQEKIRSLDKRFAGPWGQQGDVAESFAAAWAAAGAIEQAIEWYQRALRAEDGKASIKATEQLGNLQVRHAWYGVSTGRLSADDAREEIARTITLFEKLLAIHPTMERESLIASAFKRLAMIERNCGRDAEAREALVGMQNHYARAAELGRDEPQVFYDVLNCMAADLVLHGAQPKWKGLAVSAIADARKKLDEVVRDDPDFWSVASQSELRIYEAISARQLADAASDIIDALNDLHDRIAAPSKWRTVHDQAQLVVGEYAARASDSEKEAALDLVRRLGEMAERAAEPPRARPRRQGKSAKR